ncbi:LPS assembly lipoprotein LptE [Pseudoteredinibacter isoporae]|uniref:LPS-assembly lipoprotein LptE n=1 Tax=Pseudoteredinibacter isoporae TaxID=570281 RepID=UPI00310A4C78
MKSLVQVSLMTGLLLLVSACGWQLRGHVALGQDIGTLHVSSPDAELLRDLKQALRRNDITLSESNADADYNLSLQAMRFDRRTAAVGSQILAAEYELNMQVDYQIAQLKTAESQKPYVDGARASTIRSYAYDPNNTLGKDQEERQLRREMRSEIVQQILRRLALISQNNED